MQVKTILRDKHKDLLKQEEGKTYKIYTEHFNTKQKELTFLKDLLKDIEGELILKPINDSWYDYTIELIYMGQIFSIGQDWKHKLQIHSKELYKYHQSTVYAEEKKEFIKKNKPLNYTFFKLTTKKLLGVLDYYIKLIALLKRLDSNKEKENHKIYNEYKEKIDFIAEALKLKPKEYKTDHDIQYYIYTPLERLEVSYNNYDKQTRHSYNISKYIDMIKTIKGVMEG